MPYVVQWAPCSWMLLKTVPVLVRQTVRRIIAIAHDQMGNQEGFSLAPDSVSCPLSGWNSLCGSRRLWDQGLNLNLIILACNDDETDYNSISISAFLVEGLVLFVYHGNRGMRCICHFS